MGHLRKNFISNDRGQVAVTFAMMALHLMAVMSASVDFTSVMKEKQSVKAALDAAVLSAVNNNAIELSDKGDYAKTYFEANYHGGVSLNLTPLVEENMVYLTAEGEKELSFGNFIGVKNPIVSERSGAVIATENTVCLMSLNETEDRAILFDGGIKYSSPTCSVYANSTNGSAITSTASISPEAKSFCAVGGIYGTFSPYAKGECAPMADPYAATQAPTIPSACTVPMSELIVLKDTSTAVTLTAKELFSLRIASAAAVFEATGSLRAAVEDFFSYETTPLYDLDSQRILQIAENKTGSHVDVKPGVFCGGLTVDGIDVDFLPGEYIIKDGPLSFINGAEAVAEDVTFVLAGDDAVLNIQSQAAVTIKAPSKGEREGLAVMQAVDSSAPGNRTINVQTSLISGGGSLKVTGTVYLPQHTLEVRGQGTSVGSMAPATSFIADKLHISGSYGATMVVDVDHETAGVPPIQPRAEDGVRLIE